MTDEQIIAHLNGGETLHFGVHGRNMDVVNLIRRLEDAGYVQTRDASLSQETRREVWGVKPIPFFSHGRAVNMQRT